MRNPYRPGQGPWRRALLDADGALGVLAGLTAARCAERRARPMGWRRSVSAIPTTSARPRSTPGAWPAGVGRHRRHVGGLAGRPVRRGRATFRHQPDQRRRGRRTTEPTSSPSTWPPARSVSVRSNIARPGAATGQRLGHRRHGAAHHEPGEAYALSPLGGYKGQGLAMAVTLLGAVLTGSPSDWQLEQVGEGTPGQAEGSAISSSPSIPELSAGMRTSRLGWQTCSAPSADQRPPRGITGGGPGRSATRT